MALQSELCDGACFEIFSLNRLYSSTLIMISRGLPRWVMVMGACKARAMMSPDLRERSDVE